VPMSRVLITGGSGFLGRTIVAAAEQRGYEVLTPRRLEFDLDTGDGVEEYMYEATRTRPIDALIHSAPCWPTASQRCASSGL
jgi:nucleoside-diphosphate-sugar epimerase